MTQAGTLIIGAGQAGFQTAASLRAKGYEEPITLIGDEPDIPYQRPPLSKGFLLGKQNLESIELRPLSFYQSHRIDLLLGKTVESIDRAARAVTLKSGNRIPFHKLVLATGARNRLLLVKGADLDGVLYLRSVGEAVAVKQRLEAARDIVVIGGGFIGLELAAAANMLGKSVTLIEALPRLMPRVVAPVVSSFYLQLHESHGVKVVCDSCVSEIAGSAGKAAKVMLPSGGSYPADLVLVGIGVIPNSELASAAGLGVGNGITVNEHLETDDPDIYAIGDCAEFRCVFARGRMRLESVQNAADQAQCVANVIVGKREVYHELPWFWTDQFDIKLQMAGISQGHDHVVTRGNIESCKFSVFYYREGQLIAIDSVNRPLDHMFGRKLLMANVPLTPEQAADESVDLKKLEREASQHETKPIAHEAR